MITDDMTLELLLNEQEESVVQVKQGDTGRKLKLYIKNNGIEFDLTNKIVEIYGIKPDGNTIFNSVCIINDIKGICEVDLTRQMLARDGILKCEIIIYDNNEKVTSDIFKIDVIKSINNNDEIESENEFIALDELIKETKILQEKMQQTVESVDFKKSVDNYEDLSIVYPSPEDGWIVGVKSNGITYKYVQDKWIELGLTSTPIVTQEVNGLMSKEDKCKLDTIEENAQKNLTASELLTQIKSIDGENSGLDADMLDGKESTDFANTIHIHNIDDIKGLNNHNHSNKLVLDKLSETIEKDSYDLSKFATISDIQNIDTSEYMKKSVYDFNDTGIVDKAKRLSKPINITISGDVEGLATFDGSEDITVDSTIKLVSEISNGLMSKEDKLKLDGMVSGNYANAIHSHLSSDIKGMDETINKLNNHIDDSNSHVTLEDKTKWDNKLGDIHENKIASETVVGHTKVIDNLTSISSVDALSAYQGKALDDKIKILSGLVSSGSGSEVGDLTEVLNHITDTTKHINSSEKAYWNSKADENHVHSDLHTHNNKSVIDKITETKSSSSATYDLTKFATTEGLSDKFMLKEIYDINNNGIVDKTEKLSLARKISLDGDVIGNALFDGSKDVSIYASILKASAETNGLMSKQDKLKLDGIQNGAEKNLTPMDTLIQLKKVDGENSGLDADLLDGKEARDFADYNHNHNGIYHTKMEINDIRTEVENKINAVVTSLEYKESVNKLEELYTTYPTPEESWTVAVKESGVTYKYTNNEWVDIGLTSTPKVTTKSDGLMTKVDKVKLDGIEENAQANPTDIQLLAQIKAVDGENSGLDSDLFQGKNPEYFAVATHSHDDVYNTKEEIDLILNNKSNINHTHVEIHTHDNKDAIDKITSDKTLEWDNKASGNHTHVELHNHDNKDIIDSIASDKVLEWDSKAAGNHTHAELHTHDNKDAIDKITSDKVLEWDSKAVGNHTHAELHTHDNKDIIDKITLAKFDEWNNKSVFNGDYNSLINKPIMPTKVSELFNDNEYVSITDLSVKVDKETGKGLSTNDYTTEEKNKLAELKGYTLPIASSENIGGIKIGKGIDIDSNGAISANSVNVIDSLTSSSSTDALSSNQGKILKKEVDDANALLSEHGSNGDIHVTSIQKNTWNNKANVKHSHKVDDISDISIGVVNYIKNSDCAFKKVSTEFNSSENLTNSMAISSKLFGQKGDFIFSVYIKYTNLEKGTTEPYIGITTVAELEDGTTSYGILDFNIIESINNQSSDGYVRVEKSIKVNKNIKTISQINVYTNDFKGTVEFGRFKLERGTVSTDWDINIEDVEDKLSNEINTNKTDIENINNKIRQIDSKVIKLAGNSTFNSISGKTITHNLNISSYVVSITPTANPNGQLGEVWVVTSLNSFTVYCSGTTTTTPFSYIIV